MPPHCTVYLLGNLIAVALYDIERLSSPGRPYPFSAFGTLHHLQASKKRSVVCHLSNPKHLARSDTRFVRNCESRNLTSPLLTGSLGYFVDVSNDTAWLRMWAKHVSRRGVTRNRSAVPETFGDLGSVLRSVPSTPESKLTTQSPYGE